MNPGEWGLAMRLRMVCALLIITAIAAPARALPPSQQAKISVDGVIRDYRLYRPPGTTGKPVPLVLMLHGAMGTAAQIEEYIGLSAVAAREGFAVAYPQGVGRGWNDARAGKSRLALNASTADDVKFLRNLTDELIAKGIADAKRIYIAGLSNGGFMAMRMACEAPGPFAAFAPVIASAPLSANNSCRPPRPLPVLLINGTDDGLVKFSAKDALDQGNFGAVELAAFWGERNGCKGFTDEARPDLAPNDRSTVTARRYSGCSANGAVELLTVNGGGHQPPSRGNVRDYPMLARLLGVRNHDIDTAETIWAFFSRQSK
jgi:polyhydroxybutyrate depolymerase